MPPPALLEQVKPTDRKNVEEQLKDLQLEELLELKRLREENKRKEREAVEKQKSGAERVMVYSIFARYHLGNKAEKLVPVIMHDGKTRYIADPNHPHSHHQWEHHRIWMTKTDLAAARTNAAGAYGQEFVEALPANDGDPLGRNLKAMIKTKAGDQFLARMEYNDRQQMISCPITPLDVRNELERLESGALKAPK